MDILDMAWDILDTMDTLMPTAMLTTSRDLLMLNLRPRLMLTPTFCMEDMDILDMAWDILDTMDTHMLTAMLTMASALLMLNPRLMLTPTFSMVDMDMDTLDTVDTMDTPMLDMPTLDKL